MVPLGPLSIVVSGPVASTVKLRWAGVGSVFPSASVARTRMLCGPSESCCVLKGEVQGVKATLSTEHSKVELGSLEEKVNVGWLSVVVPDGPKSIVVSGGVVSTEKLRLAGLASVLPAWSVARTSKVWGPSVSAGDAVKGDEHDAKAAASKRHWKVEFDSLEENWKVGVLSAVGAFGPESIVVCGAVVSISQV